MCCEANAPLKGGLNGTLLKGGLNRTLGVPCGYKLKFPTKPSRIQKVDKGKLVPWPTAIQVSKQNGTLAKCHGMAKQKFDSVPQEAPSSSEDFGVQDAVYLCD